MSALEKKRMGRPRFQIDWDDFDKLCHIQSTLNEIAAFFKCDEKTIERSVKREFGITFGELYQRKSVGGLISIRRSMFQMANKQDRNSIPILIYLDKKFLGGCPGDNQNYVPSAAAITNVQVSTQAITDTKSTIELLREVLNKPQLPKPQEE